MTKKYVDRWDAGCDSRPLLEEADREIEHLREVLTIPNITPDTTSSALFIRTLSEHEKGQPVNGQDLINALMWRVKNQRREIARLHGEAEVTDEQLAQLRGFAEAHKTCRGSDEPCHGPHRAFLEMPEGYSGPVKVSNSGAAVAEVTVYPSPQGASRDADHCDYPDCEHHWELVVDWALAAMTKLHESAEPDTDHPEIPAIIPAAAFRAFVDEHARLMRIRASAPQGASRDASPETYNERVAGVKVMDASYPEGHYLRYGRGPGQLAGCGNWMPKHGVGPYCGNCGFHADEHCRSSRT